MIHGTEKTGLNARTNTFTMSLNVKSMRAGMNPAVIYVINFIIKQMSARKLGSFLQLMLTVTLLEMTQIS